MNYLGDASWYIDVQRRSPRAIAFLRNGPEVSVVLCEIVRAELLAANAPPPLEVTGRVLGVDRPVAERWADLSRELRRLGMPLGANDLWIASIALVHDLPLLTRDAAFRRVPALRLEMYDGTA